MAGRWEEWDKEEKVEKDLKNKDAPNKSTVRKETSTFQMSKTVNHKSHVLSNQVIESLETYMKDLKSKKKINFSVQVLKLSRVTYILFRKQVTLRLKPKV